MGNMGSTTSARSAVSAVQAMDDERVAMERSRRLDIENYQDHLREREKIKLLLLGSGESGKSTIFKQMVILYNGGYGQADRDMFKTKIHQNIVQFVLTIYEAAIEQGRGNDVSPEAANALDTIASWDLTDLSLSSPEAINLLRLGWHDGCIQETFEARSSYQLIETHSYFFQPRKLEEVCSQRYSPSNDDIVRVRVRTTGVIERNFRVEGNTFSIIDVGGQRSERRKWFSQFDGVSAVIFVAAVSEYDQVMFEDDEKNRMEDSIELFGTCANSPSFSGISMILFLNKIDLFEEKVQRENKQLADIPAFSDFSGPRYDATAGIQYFASRFRDVQQEDKDLFCHRTCATDTGIVRKVFKDCKRIILRQTLAVSGIVL